MDGKGTWRDHVFMERLWRPIKYKKIYLKADDRVRAVRREIDQHPGMPPSVTQESYA